MKSINHKPIIMPKKTTANNNQDDYTKVGQKFACRVGISLVSINLKCVCVCGRGGGRSVCACMPACVHAFSTGY